MTDIDQPELVSEEFERAFDSRSSGCRRTCECGRNHWDSHNDWDWDEGEKEKLAKQTEDHPERYIAQPNGIGSYIINGREFVMGCPCNGGAGYEKFILHYAEQIAAYLNERARRLKAEAEKTIVKV